MWFFKKWRSVSSFADSFFPKQAENSCGKLLSDKALLIRQQAIAALTNRTYVSHGNVDGNIVNFSDELNAIIKFAATQRVLFVDYPIVSRRYKLRGRAFMVCLDDDNTLHIYGISLSDKLGDKINGQFTPRLINALGKMGRKACRNIDDTPYWRIAVKMNIYRAMMVKSGAQLGRMSLIALGDAYNNFELIDIPIIDDVAHLAYKF